MFERFTDRARRVVVLAQEEARRLDHGFIGTEHLMLGLIAQGDGVGGKALLDLGLSLDTARADVERIIGRGSGPVDPGHIPFTPRSKAALEGGFREALALNHNYIGTEHVLLGLLRQTEGVAAQIMVQRFGDLDVVRNTVLQILTGLAGGVTPQPPGLHTDAYSPGLRSALELASGRATGAPAVGTQHVLAVFAEWDELAANAILRAGGFDASSLPTPPAEWDVAGTSDETEAERSRRVTEVSIAADAVTVRILDDEIRSRLAAAMEADPELQRIVADAVGEMIRRLPPKTSD